MKTKELLKNLKERITLSLINTQEDFNNYVNIKGDVDILGHTFKKSEILKELDPITYEIASYEYLRNEMENYILELNNIKIDESDEQSNQLKDEIENLLYNF